MAENNFTPDEWRITRLALELYIINLGERLRRPSTSRYASRDALSSAKRALAKLEA